MHYLPCLVGVGCSTRGVVVADGLDGTYLEAGGQETQLQCSIVVRHATCTLAASLGTCVNCVLVLSACTG